MVKFYSYIIILVLSFFVLFNFSFADDKKDINLEDFHSENDSILGKNRYEIKEKKHKSNSPIDTEKDVISSENLPGVGYALFFPKSSKFGYFQGFNINLITLSALIAEKDDFPSAFQTAMNCDLLFSNEINVDPIIIYYYSFRAAFESESKRNTFKPYFELNLGGLYQKQIGSNSLVSPAVGFWLLLGENYSINAYCGYLMPFSHIESWGGLRIGANINYLFW